MRIEGKIAVITGGASGLGAATVRYLVGKGAKASIIDMDENKAHKLIQELGSDKVDITDEQQVINAVNNTVKTFGTINILLNSAGIGYVEDIIKENGETHNSEMFKKVMNINLFGLFYVTKHVAVQMAKAVPDSITGERGVIIHISSIAAIEGTRGQIAYSASKGAIIGLTMPLARELGSKKIRVVTLAPGPFDTGIKMADYAHKLIDATILGRFGNPPELAHMVGALVENTYITGEIIRLDGGLRKPHL